MTSTAIAIAATGASASSAHAIQAHAASLPFVGAAQVSKRDETASVLLRSNRPLVLAARLPRNG